MADDLNEWRTAAYKATRERDEARADLEKWDDLRAEIHERMRAGLTELIQSKWDAEGCDPDAAMAADTVLDYLENDFAGQLARMQQRAETAEATLRVARFTAEHWREAMLASTSANLALAAHPCAMILTALDGSTDADECGISNWAQNDFRAVAAEVPMPAPEFPLPIRADGSHHYVSSGCVHEALILPDGRTGHEYCESETGALGAKIPATCKHCGAPCQCPNHALPIPATQVDCRWPGCLSEKQHRLLAAQVDAGMRGEPTVPMPDQRLVCGCVDRGLEPPDLPPSGGTPTDGPAGPTPERLNP